METDAEDNQWSGRWLVDQWRWLWMAGTDEKAGDVVEVNTLVGEQQESS